MKNTIFTIIFTLIAVLGMSQNYAGYQSVDKISSKEHAIVSFTDTTISVEVTYASFELFTDYKTEVRTGNIVYVQETQCDGIYIMTYKTDNGFQVSYLERGNDTEMIVLIEVIEQERIAAKSVKFSL